MQNYQKNTYYIIYGIRFKFYFRIYKLIRNSISLIFIDKHQHSFIENSTILKRSSAFFTSFFTRNITHFIFHSINLS